MGHWSLYSLHKLHGIAHIYSGLKGQGNIHQQHYRLSIDHFQGQSRFHMKHRNQDRYLRLDIFQIHKIRIDYLPVQSNLHNLHDSIYFQFRHGMEHCMSNIG